MRCRPLKKLLQSAALVAVLLVAQAAAVLHAEAEDVHPAGEICTVCVGLASLGTGNVAAAHHIDVVLRSAEPFDYFLVYAVVRRIERRLARGPPPAS